MSIFETERLLRAYREGCDSPVNEQATDTETSSSLPQIRRDKALGWIPNPRTPMNFFYNKVYESFYVENVSFLAVSKRKFSEEFHKEARRQYTIRQEVENLKSKSQQLHNRKNPSTAGFLLSENHTLKPHDSSIITMNLNRINQIERSAQEVEEKMKKDLQSAVLASGKIKDGRKTSHKFDEDIISDMRELKTKLATTKSRLTELGQKASNLFKVDFGAVRRKSSAKKQNKHRAAKRKARRTSQRTSEVLKKIAPTWDEESICERDQIDKELVLKLNKREKKWLQTSVCQSEPSQLSSDAKNYLSGILGMDNKFNESNTATSSDHGDDLIDDDDDLDYHGVDGDGGCEGDDCSAELDVQEIDSSDDNYGPYWENPSTSCTPYLDHLSD